MNRRSALPVCGAMLNRSLVMIAGLMLFAALCGCATDPAAPSRAQTFMRDRVEAAQKWASDMRLTPLSIVCGEFRVPGVAHERVQCDVRTLEVGVVPLTCGAWGFDPTCRLGSV
jgi:hypothetical protein